MGILAPPGPSWVAAFFGVVQAGGVAVPLSPLHPEAEIAYCDSRPNPAESYAGRFAGKEAVGKALGVGVRFTWKEIEIVGRPKPGVSLSGRTRAAWERLGRQEEESPAAAYRRLRRAMLSAERDEFIKARDAGEIDDEVLFRVLRELDLEEAALSRE